MCKDVLTYQHLFLPHPIAYISIHSFAIYFAKEGNFINLGVNPLEKITPLTFFLSSCCLSCFLRWYASLLLCWYSFCLHQWKSRTQTYFSGNSLHALIMSHSHNTTIANAFTEAQRCGLLSYDVLKCHHDHWHRLGVVWLDYVPLLWSMSRFKCCFTESVCGPNNSARTRMTGMQK